MVGFERDGNREGAGARARCGVNMLSEVDEGDPNAPPLPMRPSMSSHGFGDRCAHGPFGETLRSTGLRAAKCNWRFSTKYTDQESALYCSGYRYYCSATGRWQGRDPVGERGALNLFAFLCNHTSKGVDPLGLEALDAEIVGGASRAVCAGGRIQHGLIYLGLRFRVKDAVENTPYEVLVDTKLGIAKSDTRGLAYSDEPLLQNESSVVHAIRNGSAYQGILVSDNSLADDPNYITPTMKDCCTKYHGSVTYTLFRDSAIMKLTKRAKYDVAEPTDDPLPIPSEPAANLHDYGVLYYGMTQGHSDINGREVAGYLDNTVDEAKLKAVTSQPRSTGRLTYELVVCCDGGRLDLTRSYLLTTPPIPKALNRPNEKPYGTAIPIKD